MRFVFAWLVLIFVCFPVLADNNLLDALSSKARNIEHLNGSFVQHRKITVLPLPLISQGEFSYHYQTGMIWNTLKPVQSRVQITRKGIQTENAGSSSQISGSAQLAKALLGIFSGDLASLSAQFHIEASGDILAWHLHLVPKNELVASQITFIDIQGTEITESVAIADANGDRSDLSFTTDALVFLEK